MSAHAGGRAGGLFVGRLVAENGVGTLAEALDLYPGAHLDVIGDQARFLADWSYQRLFGERRRAARVQ